MRTVRGKIRRLFGQLRLIDQHLYWRRTGAEEKWLRRLGVSLNRDVNPPRLALHSRLGSAFPRRFNSSYFVPAEIRVLQIGRFGNAVQQVTNALRFAQNTGIQSVILERCPFLPREFRTDSGILVRQASPSEPRANPPQDVLTGRFFWLNEVSYPSEKADTDAIFRSLFRNLTFHTPKSALSEDHLVIHVRGGDVFSPKPPKDYGQPPAAFYLKILKSQKWSGVTIVHEDDVNPVLNVLAKYEKNLPYEFGWQSSNLTHDLHTLLSATNLVIGNGSFGVAVAYLSPHIKRVFRFENCADFPFTHGNFEVVTYRDASATYGLEILRSNWKNLPHQRRLMETYPTASIQLDPHA